MPSRRSIAGTESHPSRLGRKPPTGSSKGKNHDKLTRQPRMTLVDPRSSFIQDRASSSLICNECFLLKNWLQWPVHRFSTVFAGKPWRSKGISKVYGCGPKEHHLDIRRRNQSTTETYLYWKCATLRSRSSAFIIPFGLVTWWLPNEYQWYQSHHCVLQIIASSSFRFIYPLIDLCKLSTNGSSATPPHNIQ